MVLAARIFERRVVLAFSSEPERPDLSPLTAKAIVAGVRNALSVRLREGRQEELRTLTDEVLDLCESYHSPFAARIGVNSVSNAAVEPHTPAEFLLRGDVRARSLSSILHLTFDEGYEDLTDPRLAEFAGISPEVFREEFAGREEAFLALLDEIAREASAWVDRAAGGDSWPEAVRSAVGAFVDYAASHEALMRIAFIELFAVGPGVVDRIGKPVVGLTRLLMAGAPEPRHAPLIAEEAVAGALWGVLSAGVAGRRVSQLPRLVEHLTFIVLAPYIGAEDAFVAIVASRRPPDAA
jgi:AcrR family transcriptional regulator